ncbi:SprT family protein [Bacillus kwashiorkori]|uniref:SprT family protein n=1 Tax=Bacillus kwashiorkori TaxID=1522318 RepID=UPI0007857EE0|nr:SprT family protein [Bacillus kwashiorkori]
MNDNELQKLVEEVSLQFFHSEFKHTAYFNPRLRTTGGRYMLRTGNIEINKKYFDYHGKTELINIIKHELCHYHLHQLGKGYKHKDRDFKMLAKAVGAPRFCTPIPNETKQQNKPFHIYQCVTCSQTYKRQRRINTSRFVCGKCRGKLILVKS